MTLKQFLEQDSLDKSQIVCVDRVHEKMFSICSNIIVKDAIKRTPASYLECPIKRFSVENNVLKILI